MFFDGTPCPEHRGELLGGQIWLSGMTRWIQVLRCFTEGCHALEGPICQACPDVQIHTQFRHEPGRKSKFFGDEAPDFFRCIRCAWEIDASFPHDYNNMKSPLARRRAQGIWDSIPAHLKRTTTTA